MTRPRLAAVALLGTAVVAAGESPAGAARPGISLRSSRHVVTAGQSVVLRGGARAADRGDRVRIRNARHVIATTRTDAAGRYSIAVRPWRDTRYRARWKGRSSAPVLVRVRARLGLRLRKLRLFGLARVEGEVRPASAPGRAWVRVWRNGRPLLRRAVSTREGARFELRFRVRRPGTYRAALRYDDARHLPVSATTRRRALLPRLAWGARGPAVRLLEMRLHRLRYHIRGVDRSYDRRTGDALSAFHKVQRRPWSSVVTADTWRALARPRRPRPRALGAGTHIEIDQTKQTLYTVRDGRITNILHTSTGRDGATRDGVFYVFRKLAGYSPGRLYYPSYFDGLRAIHGWPRVPPNAASHGCARVPMWAARWLYRRARVGMQVRVYH